MDNDTQNVTPYQSPGVTYTQPTPKPTQKMTTVGLAGVVVTAVVGILAAFGVQVPADVSGAVLTGVSAVVTVVTFVAGYVKKEKK